MPRPKGDDPRRAVTLRIRASTLARYAALGEDWRAKMEAAIERFGMPVPLPVAPKPVARVQVDVPVYAPKRFNPQPKTGKK
jgi:hypothetical protein